MRLENYIITFPNHNHIKKKNKETKLVHSIRDQIYGERGGSDKGHQGERSNKQKDSKAAIQPCHRPRR